MNAILITALTIGIPIILGGIGYGLWRGWNAYTDAIAARKVAQAEAIAAKETIERINTDAATLKSVSSTVDNLPDASVHSMLEAEWGSPKQ